jgi:hypothetical protein
LLLIQQLIQPAIGLPGVIDIQRVIPLEHQRCLVPREFHDDRVVNSRLPGVGIEGVAEIMKLEFDYSRLPAGIDYSLLVFLKAFLPIREWKVMIKESDLPGNNLFIISLIAKEDNPRLP